MSADMELLDFNDDCPVSCTDHISCVIQHVENPLQLLDDMVVIAESELEHKPQSGDKEQAMIYRHARDQLLLRPSDPVVWSIIRWMLVGESEQDINTAASEIRRQQMRSVS